MKALILGCAGLALTNPECVLFREANPWGFILFKRNVDTPDQVRDLTASLRGCVGRDDAPIFVDQEGGRVQRLQPPYWPSYPSSARFAWFDDDLVDNATALSSREAVWLGARLIASDLRDVGITANCAPVLDVPTPGSNGVIGNRAFSTDPETVAELGRAAVDGYLAGGVLPVVKHIPGHGRGNADSHLALPVVDVPIDELREHDFIPFKAMAHAPVAMTAHVKYTQIDPDNAATVSPTVIRDVIRGEIGFDGLLLTDDLSMQALSGTIPERAVAALAAGCDIALHCNGNLEEMRELVEVCPELSGESLERAQRAQALLQECHAEFDPVDGRRRLEAALANLPDQGDLLIKGGIKV